MPPAKRAERGRRLRLRFHKTTHPEASCRGFQEIIDFMSKHTVKITDNGAVLWEGEYEIAPDTQTPEAEISILEKEDDSWPALLCEQGGTVIRELSSEECGKIQELGRIKEATVRHPRATRYGHPVCAVDIPEVWKGTIGNMGYKPDERLELFCEDTEDDAAGETLLHAKIPESLKEKMDWRTKSAQMAYRTEGKTPHPKDPHPLTTATLELASRTTEELEALEKECETRCKAWAGDEAARKRGDELLRYLDVRKTVRL